MADFTSDDIASLAAKLDGLDLASGERAALDAVFDAAESDVDGFAVGPPPEPERYANLETNFFRLRLLKVLGSYIGETEKNLDGR